MRICAIAAMFMSAALVIGCGKSEQKDAQAEASAAAPAQGAPVAPVPDVGKLTTVPVKADGTGRSPGEAVNEAIKLAILQANGASVDMSSEQFKFALDVATPFDSGSIRAASFAEIVAQKSKGAVTGFSVSSLTGPDANGLYKASIEASVAKFVAPADSKKLKVVVAPIKIDMTQIELGDTTIPADKVAQDIRQQVIDALSQTGRFSVLDRDTSDVQGELDLISSGQAPAAEIAKLSQAMSADVVWVGHINSLSYHKTARKLETSDRELVSYGGGWSVSQRIVNVATRQLLEADTLEGQAASIRPTTLGARFDSSQTLREMETDIVGNIVSATLMRTFPVTVISRDGNNVVLSQGGQSVKETARYQLVSMGAEMKDPQTGESLGRVETPCCEVVIDRVTPKMSYGHLENVTRTLDGTVAGTLQVRGIVKTSTRTELPVPASNSAPNISSADASPLAATQVALANHATSLRVSKKTSRYGSKGGVAERGDDANW